MNAIEMINITKKFGDFTANNNINLVIKQNEVHAILGENGAGKSTLMNLLFGIHNPTSGEIKVNGKVVNIKNPNVANELKIGMVHQHFKLIETFTIVENIILGSEPHSGPFLKLKDATLKIQKLADKYHFALKANMKIKDLSVGEQQKVEILKMLYKDSDILIFDEPTGALIPDEVIELMNIIKKLKADGKTILLITHKLSEIKQVADVCTIIRRGVVIDTIDVKDATESSLAEMMVGRPVNFSVDKGPYNPLNTILEVRNLFIKSNNGGDDSVKNFSFNLKSGEILGIAGVDGNGQVELIEGITGLRPIKSGVIKINDKNISKKSIRSRTELGIAHIPQDRHKFGLVLDYDIGENAVLQEYYKKPFSK